jgi:predicted lipoprotein with Yx(FWY)xxD motif
MIRAFKIALGVAAVVAGAGACGSSGSSPSSSLATTTAARQADGRAATPSVTVSAPAMVKEEQSPLGEILVDGAGRTLYLFKADTGTTSTCYGACAASWPPLLTAGKPTGSGGVNASQLGTSARSDHTTQVTYHGHPLYHFAADTAPGQTKGQGLNAFGALWYVVGPNGNAITTAASRPASPSATKGGGGY